MTNPDLIELAMRMVQTKAPNSRLAADGEPEPPQHEPPEVQTPPPVPTAPANLGLLHTPHVKGTKSADELGAMILTDLREMKGCPEAGVNVTVYGFNPGIRGCRLAELPARCITRPGFSLAQPGRKRPQA